MHADAPCSRRGGTERDGTVGVIEHDELAGPERVDERGGLVENQRDRGAGALELFAGAEAPEHSDRVHAGASAGEHVGIGVPRVEHTTRLESPCAGDLQRCFAVRLVRTSLARADHRIEGPGRKETLGDEPRKAVGLVGEDGHPQARSRQAVEHLRDPVVGAAGIGPVGAVVLFHLPQDAAGQGLVLLQLVGQDPAREHLDPVADKGAIRVDRMHRKTVAPQRPIHAVRHVLQAVEQGAIEVEYRRGESHGPEHSRDRGDRSTAARGLRGAGSTGCAGPRPRALARQAQLL